MASQLKNASAGHAHMHGRTYVRTPMYAHMQADGQAKNIMTPVGKRMGSRGIKMH